MRRHLRNHRLVITVSLLLSFVTIIAVIGPVTAQVSFPGAPPRALGPVAPAHVAEGVLSQPPLDSYAAAYGASDLSASSALSLPFPGPRPPRPYPPNPRPPVSGTVRISGTVYAWPYVLPWWCYWPPVGPSSPPGLPTPLPPTPIPSPTPGGPGSGASYSICPQVLTKVPKQVQDDAIAQPWTIYGYGMRLNPNVPEHPLWNSLRTNLGILNPNVPYHVCNPVVWKSGCP